MINKPKPQLQINVDLEGGLHAGYMRNDAPSVFHTIVRAKGGQVFQIYDHWPCEVCTEHDFTREDFLAQWPAAEKEFEHRSLE